MNVYARLDHRTIGADPGEMLPLAPSLERRRLQCYLALIITDIASLLAGAWLAGFAYLGRAGAAHAVFNAQLVLPVFLTIAIYNSSYSIQTLRRPLIGMLRALVAILISWTALIFFDFYTRSGPGFSRAFVTLAPIVGSLVLIATRLLMRAFVRWRCGATVFNELVIDDGGPDVNIPGALLISAEALQLKPALDCPFSLDRVGLMLRNIDRVVVSCPPERRSAWALTLKGANIAGEVIDDTVVELGAHGARVIAGHGFLMVSAGPLGLRARVIKRTLDFTLAAGALVALMPLLVLVAIAIKLEDGGPVFFSQRRLGRGNRFFEIQKFRSMSVCRSDKDGHVSASREDARVTRVGRIIRRTSIDELPQLFNVLRGEMSLVGPRPHAIGSQAGAKMFWEVDLRYWQRHCLKPGLSGLAQVRGYRGATDHEDDLVNRLQSDLEYLEGWTIWRDLKIIAMTVRVLIHDRAY